MYYIEIDVHRKKCVTTIKGDTKRGAETHLV